LVRVTAEEAESHHYIEQEMKKPVGERNFEQALYPVYATKTIEELTAIKRAIHSREMNFSQETKRITTLLREVTDMDEAMMRRKLATKVCY